MFFVIVMSIVSILIVLIFHNCGSKEDKSSLKQQVAEQINFDTPPKAKSPVVPLVEIEHPGASVMVQFLVDQNNRSMVCVLYEDTDYGQEILDAAYDQLEEMNMPLIETASAKPTDTDFSSQIKKLQNAGCDLIAMGTQIRSTIIPYIKAKEINWNNVDFVATSASYFSVVAEQPNGIMDGLYCLNGIVVPYYDTASDLEKDWWDRFRSIYSYEPNSGAIYGYIYADIFIEAVKRAGKDLSVKSFVSAMESLENYADPLRTGTVTFTDTQRQGSNISYFFQVQNGKFEVISGPINY